MENQLYIPRTQPEKIGLKQLSHCLREVEKISLGDGGQNGEERLGYRKHSYAGFPINSILGNSVFSSFMLCGEKTRKPHP